MPDIEWVKYNPVTDTCKLGSFLLKRKLVSGVTIFEIWESAARVFHTTQYSEFQKKIQLIKEGKFKT